MARNFDLATPIRNHSCLTLAIKLNLFSVQETAQRHFPALDLSFAIMLRFELGRIALFEICKLVIFGLFELR